MEIIKWIGMILGIFILLYISVKLLLRSEEKMQASSRTYRKNKKQTEELNKQLDETIIMLESQNESLEKVSDFFKKVNTRVFKD
ncbi:MAG: hypothetical protein ACK5LC_07110 [Coprobacillaceae bacterium]